MGRLDCNPDGGFLNDSKFSQPMPWIGIYAAGASLACLLAMAADTLHGFRQRKLWFPCKFFSLNSISLTLLSIAIKLPMDLNTSMPRRQDQLSKLSSTTLICIAMANFMPSLGTMENKEMSMNIIALGILVITLIANICIQKGTGVIYVLQRQHAIIMFSMIALLVILVFSALTVQTTKKLLEKQYLLKHQEATDEGFDEAETSVVKKLSKDVKKYWMMAHTCSPQYVIGRSVTCATSGAFCLLCTLTLLESILQSEWSSNFCRGESAYKWSTKLVLIIQSTAVGIGTIAPTYRWFNAIDFRCHGRGEWSFKKNYKVERFWVQRLVEWRENPLALGIRSRQFRKFVHGTKNLLLDFCIRMQTVIVLLSKFVWVASILFASEVKMLLSCCCRWCCYCCRWCCCCWCCCCCCCCRKGSQRKLKSNESVLNNNPGSESGPNMKLDLNHFVLHLEGEEKLVELIAKNSSEATDHWIQRGRKKQPTYLIQLLGKSTMSQGFKGVKEFDSDQVPSLGSEEPPNCWALPLVTLMSIAMALPNIDHNLIKWLLDGVSEGIRYVRLIEKNLDTKGGLINIRKAANITWLQLDLYNQWLDEDVKKLALQGKHPKEILEELADTGKNYVMEFNNGARRENPLEWPVKVLAANSMYRVSTTILQDYSNSYQTVDKLFEHLTVTISDILGACLTNLPHVIALACFCSAIEEREKSILKAACLLGETEKILNTLCQHALLDLDSDQMAYIDNWRCLSEQNPSYVPPSTPDDNV